MGIWRLGAHLGSGGFGKVCEATYIDSDGTEKPGFAIKELIDPSDADAVARFSREVRLVRENLNDHPNILSIVWADLSASPPRFAMPLAESNLRKEIAAGRGNDEDWVVRCFGQILTGVSRAHELGILHRDLKPDNVLFLRDIPRISDFGLGKSVDSASTTLTNSHLPLGTLAYMAPEQWSDAKNVDARADVYALGKILCEMFNAKVPQPFAYDHKGVPVAYRYFISKCCQQNPQDRYASGAAALEAFNDLVGGLNMDLATPERAQEIIEEWRGMPPGDDLQATRDLDELFRRNPEEEGVYLSVVPRLPEAMLKQYMEEIPTGFAEMLTVYDGHIDGGLTWDYCDVAGNFYKSVWDATDDPALQRLLLARLVALGASHNRFHIGRLVADMLGGITDPGTAALAAEVLKNDPDHVAFFEPYLGSVTVPRTVRQAIRDAMGLPATS